jgi:nucleolar protein 56
MKAWFGELSGERLVLAGSTPEALAAFAAKADSSDMGKDLDLARMAGEAGLRNSFNDYRKLMHETAMLLARNRIATILSSEDADIVQSIRALDTLIDAFNEMSERIVEWYGIHHPEAKIRTPEIIDRLTARENTGDPEALRRYALAARAFLEERKRLEAYISACMEDVAPNLSGVLGPMLGARLIARAGGLEKLAKLPASAFQVIGAREALFKHLREGTPPPKHGFIYRHPLVSGSPKPLRGRIARMLAGKAAIAARVDYYSGERLSLGETVKRKAAAIRGRRGRPADGR